MNWTHEASASPLMPPPALPVVEKPRQKKIPEEEWNTHKNFIVETYPMKGMTLHKLEMVLQERGFFANLRQLRRKIMDWGLDKKVKPTEMKVIARKRQRRLAQGKSTNFRVRGQTVRDDKIDRWMKRNGPDSPPTSPYLGNSPVPSTPTMSVISYNTISEMGSSIPHPSSTSFVQLAAPQQEDENNRVPPSFSPVPINEQLSTARYFDDMNRYEDTDGSQFGGQSPALFTAPPTPTLSLQHPSTIQSQSHPHPSEAANDLVWADHPGTKCFSQSNRKTRYLEKEENELRQRLDDFRDRFGPQHPAYLNTLHRLVDLLEHQGRFKAAETGCRELIESNQNVFGDDDHRSLGSSAHLAWILHCQGRDKSSLVLLRKAHDRASAILPKSHLTLLYIEENLANVLRMCGNFNEAELMLRGLLRIRASGRAVNDDSVLRIMSSLASVLRVMGDVGKLAESEKILREVIKSRTLSASSQELILEDTSNLSLGLLTQGKLNEAELKMREVYSKQTTLLGVEHPQTLTSHGILAQALIAQQQFDEADIILRDTIQKMCRVLGLHHPATAIVQNDLIRVLTNLGKYTEAEILAKQQISICEKYFGSNDRSTIDCTRFLGNLYGQQGRFEEALSTSGRALKNSTEHFGTKHLLTKKCSADMAWVLQKESRSRSCMRGT